MPKALNATVTAVAGIANENPSLTSSKLIGKPENGNTATQATVTKVTLATRKVVKSSMRR